MIDKENKTKGVIALSALALLLVLGFGSQWMYVHSADMPINKEKVENFLESKMAYAEKSINSLIAHNHLTNCDSIFAVAMQKTEGCLYFMYHNDSLTFWSDNRTTPHLASKKRWEYTQLSNIHAIGRRFDCGNGQDVLSVFIPIKYNYPYENEELQNDYVEGLPLDKEIELFSQKPSGQFNFFNSHQEFLFGLHLPLHKIYNEQWEIAAFIFFMLALLWLLFLFSHLFYFIENRKLTFVQFLIVTGVMGSLIVAMLWYNFPTALFQNHIFTSYQYASNSILRTIVHFTVLTFFVSASFILFSLSYKCSLTKKSKYRIPKALAGLSMSALLFFFFFNLMMGLVFNSSKQVYFLSLDDFTFVTVWRHVLFYVWGMAIYRLHFKVYRNILSFCKTYTILLLELVVWGLLALLTYFTIPDYFSNVIVMYAILSTVMWIPHFYKKVRFSNLHIGVYLLVFTLFFTNNVLLMHRQKEFEKHRTVAENQYFNGLSYTDEIAETLLESLEQQLLFDPQISQMIINTDSTSTTAVRDYINNTYLRGFWQNYNMHLIITTPESKENTKRLDNIKKFGLRLRESHFYSYSDPNSDVSYLGAFTVKKGRTINFFMEFSPHKNFNSYSFPDLLVEGSQKKATFLEGLSIARYENNELIKSTGELRYPLTEDWINGNSQKYYKKEVNGYWHYVYKPNEKEVIVLSRKKNFTYTLFMLYNLYIYILSFIIIVAIALVYEFIFLNKKVMLRFATKILYVFVILLIISWFAMFYTSLNYIHQRYRKGQIEQLERQKRYIQNTLQEHFYWESNFNESKYNILAFDLQKMSFLYHTDIHVYDNNGKLIASSQPALFSRKLISKQMASRPFFFGQPNLYQYENIGNMTYLVAYTEFLNGENQQIGYIAVPKFISEKEVQNNISDFWKVIIHIYIIIMILIVVLGYFVGKRLSAPLDMIEEKLKTMRFDRKNERINYSSNDELGQLVAQYNRTIGELERTSFLLAKSERESAWKTMARQVAHEIKNPLTPMKLTIQQLQRMQSIKDERFEEYFDRTTTMLVEQIESLSDIANSFSNFAKLSDVKMEKIDLVNKVKSAVLLFEVNAENVDVKYLGQHTPLFIFANEDLLKQIFNNLLTNAIQAIPRRRKGKVRVEVHKDKNEAIVTVADNGKGVSEEAQNKIFIPHFTTKNRGMGLGLAITQSMIKQFKGEIGFETEINEGTTFIIRLPIAK